MIIGDKILIAEMSHKDFLAKGIVVYCGKNGQRVIESENNTLIIVRDSELAYY